MKQTTRANHSKLRLMALAWLVVCVFALFIDIQTFRGGHVTTDLFSLLPQNEQSLEKQKARESILLAAQDELMVMVGVDREDPATLLPRLKTLKKDWIDNLPFSVNSLSNENNHLFTQSLQHVPYLTLDDEKRLSRTDDATLLAWALSQATGFTNGSFVSFADDPLGLYTHWLYERSHQTPLRPMEGFLTCESENLFWVVMRFEVPSQVAMDKPLQQALDTFKETIQKEWPEAQFLATGVPLFTNAAANTAQKEMTLIGLLSSVGVLALAWYWFSSLKTILSIATITLSALTVALATTATLCGQVHLITLVFGMSLIGITVDYSAHYFCRQFGLNDSQKAKTLPSLKSNLALAFLSTSVAFGIMTITPLPGLQQIATFCVSGLLATLIGVILWLPFFDRHAQTLPPHIPTLEKLFSKLPTWHRLIGTSRFNSYAIGFVTIAFIVSGWMRLDYSADIRDLNHFSNDLIQQSIDIQKRTKTPSTSQYFLVSADSLETVLQKEEALKAHLHTNPIEGVSLLSLSDWVPSEARQQHTLSLKRALIERLNPMIEPMLGANLKQPPDIRVTVEDFLQSPWAEAFKGKLFTFNGQTYSLVTVIGLNRHNVNDVRALADIDKAITWIDTTEELSELLNHYRRLVMTFLSIGLLGVIVLLSLRFKKEAWRAWLPTVTGILLTGAILGWLGHHVSIFTVLAGILLLGLGIDYGIFLTASPKDNRALVAVAFAAFTTFLSFGLLALSATPALHTFGLAIAIGQCLIWVLTPLWRKDL